MLHTKDIFPKAVLQAAIYGFVWFQCGQTHRQKGRHTHIHKHTHTERERNSIYKYIYIIYIFIYNLNHGCENILKPTFSKKSSYKFHSCGIGWEAPTLVTLVEVLLHGRLLHLISLHICVMWGTRATIIKVISNIMLINKQAISSTKNIRWPNCVYWCLELIAEYLCYSAPSV